MDHNGGVSTPHRGYQTIVRPTLSTTRTSVDLLGLAWPFSQVRLLTQDEFLRQAADRRVRVGGYRGHDLNRSALEELHRVGVLVPPTEWTWLTLLPTGSWTCPQAATATVG
jgi:hypothetical protein